MSDRNIVHRLVVKIGASVLTDQSGRVIPERIEALAGQVAGCLRQQQQPVIVSSGAIACGMAALGVAQRPAGMAQLQACAAVGQGELMRLYTSAFGRHQVTTAQVLLTQEDLANRRRFRNAKQTLLTLLHRHIVPIVNENDTVATDEITFGDNDRLAALVAACLEAQLLILLSDVDGLLKDGTLIERVETLNHAHHAAVHGVKRQTTTGGMASKLEAARIVGHHGIPMVIANGTRPSVLTELLAGQPLGTLFVPPSHRLSPRKWWIAFSLRQPHGELVVDAGAAEALLERGKSLLPSGVVEVRGRFEAGACVTMTDTSHREVARGICNFSSTDLRRIRGLKSTEAARALGHSKAREVVHRDHLVLAREIRA